MISTEEKTAQGSKVSIGYGETEYPKNENETYKQYLLRLSIIKDEELGKGIAKTISSIMPEIKSFSNALGNSIKDTLSWGESLNKTMESIRPIDRGHTVKGIVSQIEATPILSKDDLSDIGRLQEQIRLRPFNEIENRLDQLINTSAQAAEFMIKANEIQTRIAGEIKYSSDETTKYSKRNIFLTVVVIFFRCFGYNIFFLY